MQWRLDIWHVHIFRALRHPKIHLTVTKGSSCDPTSCPNWCKMANWLGNGLGFKSSEVKRSTFIWHDPTLAISFTPPSRPQFLLHCNDTTHIYIYIYDTPTRATTTIVLRGHIHYIYSTLSNSCMPLWFTPHSTFSSPSSACLSHFPCLCTPWARILRRIPSTDSLQSHHTQSTKHLLERSLNYSPMRPIFLPSTQTPACPINLLTCRELRAIIIT